MPVIEFLEWISSFNQPFILIFTDVYDFHMLLTENKYWDYQIFGNNY